MIHPIPSRHLDRTNHPLWVLDSLSLIIEEAEMTHSDQIPKFISLWWERRLITTVNTYPWFGIWTNSFWLKPFKVNF